MKRFLIFIAAALGAAAICLSGLWLYGAISFQGPSATGLRDALAYGAGLLLLACAGALFTRRWRAGLALAVAILGASALWWSSILPLGSASWADDVAREPTIALSGDVATIRNVRNFDWTSADVARERWETRSYDIETITGVWVAFSHWGSPAIAHTIVSFEFKDGRKLAFSIEIRKRRGQDFSSVAGFFKSYEIVAVVADEADVIKVRTNRRGEDVYLYRADVQAETAQRLFRHYVALVNDYAKTPRFYDTLTMNCTTVPFELARATGGGLPLDWRVLVSGYGPNYLYDNGFLDRSLPFAELQKRAAISERAKAMPDGANYSDWVRGVTR